MIRDEVVIGIGREAAPVTEVDVAEMELEGMVVGEMELEIEFEVHSVVVEGVILGRKVGPELGPVEVKGVFLGSVIAKVEVVGVVHVSDAGREVVQVQV